MNSPPDHCLSDRTKPLDSEKQTAETTMEAKKSVYAGLGWLDRLLVLWILLAIVIGILLGNFVDSVGPALQKGKFVGVSVPIGMFNL
jgi:arsenite transporter